MYRLLIVDDEEDIRRGLALFFPWDEIGFEVIGTADNGKVAFEMVRSGTVDVVFCDIRMPVMSGIDLAKAIFEAGLKAPVVFLSAFKDFSYAQQALQFGVRGYVLKPTDYANIRSVFGKLKRELDSERLPPPAEADDGDRALSGPRGDVVVAAVRSYVERDCARATLKGAARVVHMNSQYLSRLFKERAGENFHVFLARVRMEKAAQLLRDGGYLTYEVSAIVGYGNQKNFTRAFQAPLRDIPAGVQADALDRDVEVRRVQGWTEGAP
jgi:YesN/AraC family two-component response regulator